MKRTVLEDYSGYDFWTHPVVKELDEVLVTLPAMFTMRSKSEDGEIVILPED